MQDLRQTSEYAKYIRLLGWQTKKLSGNYIYLKKIPLIGTFLKLQRPKTTVQLGDLQELTKKNRAYGVLIEPTNLNQRDYYLKSDYKEYDKPSLPSKTVVLNLALSQQDLLRQMHHKTRYNIRLSKRREVVVLESEDIDEFNRLWHQAARRRRMYFSMEKEIESVYRAFGKKRSLLLAQKDNKVLGGLLILYTKTTAYYMYAASSEVGNKNFAPTLLTWEAIVRSKKIGKKRFDFEGVFDQRYPLNTWKGFTRFKKSFGGAEVEYPGPLVLWRIPI